MQNSTNNEKHWGDHMPDNFSHTVNDSTAMQAALVHIMLLDDYIDAVLTRAEECEPGFLRDSLIEYVETLQRERLSYYRIGLQQPIRSDAPDEAASLSEAA